MRRGVVGADDARLAGGLRTTAAASPWFWEMVALEWARPGREADLCAAIEAYEKGLEGWPEGTTASAWIALRRTRELLELRLATVRGGPEVRHHPGPNARHAAVLRFA